MLRRLHRFTPLRRRAGMVFGILILLAATAAGAVLAQAVPPAPHHLVFVTQPSTVQATTTAGASYMCPPPTVKVVAADGSTVTNGTAIVTVRPERTSGDPGLGGTTSAPTAAGVATFGALDCSSGLTATNLGTGYRLGATAIWQLGGQQLRLYTSAASAPFDVVQVVTVCPANQTCGATVPTAHMVADIDASSAPTTDVLQMAVGIDSTSNTTCEPNSYIKQLPVVRVLVDHRDKTVTLDFDQFLVNQSGNNGRPLFTVCFAAPWSGWLTNRGLPPTFNTVTSEFEGALPTCGVAGLPAGNPCVSSRTKQATGETVVVFVPYLAAPGRADPKFW